MFKLTLSLYIVTHYIP